MGHVSHSKGVKDCRGATYVDNHFEVKSSCDCVACVGHMCGQWEGAIRVVAEIVSVCRESLQSGVPCKYTCVVCSSVPVCDRESKVGGTGRCYLCRGYKHILEGLYIRGSINHVSVRICGQSTRVYCQNSDDTRVYEGNIELVNALRIGMC